jgi:DNA-binding Lrp family transcriptional regulator
MRPELTELDRRLLNDFQQDFPLSAAPYADMARALGVTEEEVLARLRELKQAGAISRVGAVVRPNTVGVSTLAAMAVPPDELETVAAIVNGYTEVNHNYEREHRLNLWFVAAAADEAALDATLEKIARLTGISVLKLPLVEEYHIDLGFPLAGDAAPRTPRARKGRRVVLGEADRKLVAALEDGLALEPRPYAALGARGGLDEQAVIDRLARWQAEGLIRRFGVVVRHHELGWRANAMAVWDVPDDRAARFGRMLAAAEGVTLAYRRARRRPAWAYNLYCMVHGTERRQVAARIEALNRELGLDAFPHAVLFSRTRFKQTGPRYSAMRETAHG